MDLLSVMDVLEAFRDLNPTMQMQTAASFVYVANNDGKATLKELATLLGVSQATASRSILVYRKEAKPGVPGFDFIDYQEDPNDRKRKLLYLTPKGKRFAKKLEKIN